MKGLFFKSIFYTIRLYFVLPRSRFRHSIAVGNMFYDLSCGKIDRHLARLMGLFHDIAHSWDEEKLCDFISKNSISLQPGESDDAMLLHAPVASFMLKSCVADLDEKYYKALRYHTCPISTLGDEELNFFVADKIDITRKHISPEFRKKVISQLSPRARAYLVLKMQSDYLSSQSKSFIGPTQEFYELLKTEYVGL